VYTKDDLVHQIIDAGEQEVSGLVLPRGALIPQSEASGAIGGLLDAKIEEGLSYTISSHLYTTGL